MKDLLFYKLLIFSVFYTTALSFSVDSHAFCTKYQPRFYESMSLRPMKSGLSSIMQTESMIHHSFYNLYLKRGSHFKTRWMNCRLQGYHSILMGYLDGAFVLTCIPRINRKSLLILLYFNVDCKMKSAVIVVSSLASLYCKHP